MYIKVLNIPQNSARINFKGEEKETQNVSSPKDDENKESFYERNKAAILAIGALGIAGLAFAAHRHFKKISKFDSGDFTALLSKSAKEKLNNFKTKLNGEDATEDIKNILAEDDNILRYEAIKHLIDNAPKHINEKSWENIFDIVTSLKTTEKLKEKFIVAHTNKLLTLMLEKDLFKPEVIDKVLSKTENVSDNLKVNILHNLSQGHFESERSMKLIVPEFTTEQIKKAIQILETVKGNDFVYQKSAGGIIEINTKLDPAGIIYEYSTKYLKQLNFDENYISEFKKIISSDKLSDSIKLQIIDDIAGRYDINTTSEIGIKLYKEMLTALEKNSAEKYSKPNQFISFVYDKFSLGYRLANHITTYDSYGIVSLEEKLRITQMLKEMSKTIAIKKGDIGGNSHYINNLLNEELYLKNEIFFKNFSKESTPEDIEKFVDEMLNSYKVAKDQFIDGGSIFDNMDKSKLETYFNTFRISTYKLIQKLRYANMYNKEKAADTERVAQIIGEKFEQFAEKHFNTSESRRYSRFNTSNSSGYSEDYFNNAQAFINEKIEQAKSEIIDSLKDEGEFKDILEQLKSKELTKEIIKSLKRKVALKFHPDRAGVQTEEAKNELTAKFQKLNGLVELLEKVVD